MRRANDMVKRGRLDKIIAYHFWVPGADNWGAFEQALDDAGGCSPSWPACSTSKTAATNGTSRGDQTPGVKDWVKHAENYFQNKQAVSIYLNFRSNASLLVGITDIELRGCKLIVPGYHDPPPYTPPGIVPFGHQYTDKENTPPFGRTDMNQTNLTLPSYLAAWGVNGGAAPTPQPEPELPPTTELGLELIAATVPGLRGGHHGENIGRRQ